MIGVRGGACICACARLGDRRCWHVPVCQRAASRMGLRRPACGFQGGDRCEHKAFKLYRAPLYASFQKHGGKAHDYISIGSALSSSIVFSASLCAPSLAQQHRQCRCRTRFELSRKLNTHAPAHRGRGPHNSPSRSPSPPPARSCAPTPAAPPPCALSAPPENPPAVLQQPLRLEQVRLPQHLQLQRCASRPLVVLTARRLLALALALKGSLKRAAAPSPSA